MTVAGLQALLSHWLRNPWQAFTMIAGLAMATALWAGVQAINAEARASYDRAAQAIGQTRFDQIVRTDGGALGMDDFVALRRAGWLVSPLLEGEVALGRDTFQVIGVDPLTLPRDGAVPALPGAGDLVEFLSPDGIALVHPDDAGALANLGPKIEAQPDVGQGTIVVNLGQAHELLGRAGVMHLVAAEKQPLGRPPLAAVNPAFELREHQEQGDVERLTQSFHMNLTAFGLLSFAVGIFIVYGAIGLAFEQRRAVFRTLRTLGVPLSKLFGLLALELTIFAFLAGTFGVALGYVFAAALLPDVAATLRGLYGADIAGDLSLRSSWWLSGLGMALGGTMVAAVGVFARLNRLPVLAANQPRAWVFDARRSNRLMALFAGGLAVVGIVLAISATGLPAGFATLACLLIAGALSLPLFLDLMLRRAEGLARNAVPQWFWADARQQLPGLSMALMALLLAMAANIGVSTMVSSFRLTFVGWLDQRLASEIYVTARDPEEAAALTQFLVGKVDAALPIVFVERQIGDLPAQVYGVIDHATYRDNWHLLESAPDAWDKLAAGQGVLVNEQLYRREGLAIGDSLADGSGDRVVGVYGDYGNPIGQVVMGYSSFRQKYPGAIALRYGIRTGSTDPNALADEIRQTFDLPDDAVVDQVFIKGRSKEIFERTFSVTSALNMLTLSVAGFAILISLLTLATMRLPQLAPLWALGLTRRQLASMELARAAILAALTGVAAMPLGLGLAWVLLAIVNVQAFGWRLPMHVFPFEYLKLAGLTLVAALLAALWPAVRLARTPADALLKVFSNER